MNINDLGWITLLLLLLLLMIMCFTTLGERGGKLHTTAHLGHRFSYATFQRPKRRLLEQILLFCSFVEQNFPAADVTTCQRRKTRQGKAERKNYNKRKCCSFRALSTNRYLLPVLQQRAIHLTITHKCDNTGNISVKQFWSGLQGEDKQIHGEDNSKVNTEKGLEIASELMIAILESHPDKVIPHHFSFSLSSPS